MSTASELDPSILRPTVAEISLAAFRRNLRAVRAMLPAESRLIAVLKADAYGHGAVPLARVCVEEQIEMIAVSLLEEAIELQSAGIATPLLVLGPLQESQISEAIERGVIIGVVGPEELEQIAAAPRAAGREVHVHLKLDSGMGRMGLRSEDLPRIIATLKAGAGISVDAVYTHFANASDENDPFTARQLAKFQEMVRLLADEGVRPPLHHVANSAATVRRLVTPGDYARVGITLYGGEPLDYGSSRLEPVMRWSSRIARLKSIAPGDAVGYGTTFIAARPTRVATLPVGYADGYNRQLSSRGSVLLRGKRVPVIGRVSMDLVTIDVTEVAEVALGDEVVLLGRQGEEEITAEEIAGIVGTISYEIFCAVGARVPRSYVEEGERSQLHSKFAAALER